MVSGTNAKAVKYSHKKHYFDVFLIKPPIKLHLSKKADKLTDKSTNKKHTIPCVVKITDKVIYEPNLEKIRHKKKIDEEKLSKSILTTQDCS